MLQRPAMQDILILSGEFSVLREAEPHVYLQYRAKLPDPREL